MPEIRLEGGGEAHVLSPWKKEEKLVVLGRTSDQIVLLHKSDVEYVEDSVQIINFVDQDTYWVYLGHSPLAGAHVREYFTRIRSDGP